MTNNNYAMEQQDKACECKKTMVGKTYKHFKGGIYVVDTVAVRAEDSSLRVIYHNANDDLLVWDRDLDEFFSPVDKVKYPDATQVNRFELVN